jgi:hypothetical protein
MILIDAKFRGLGTWEVLALMANASGGDTAKIVVAPEQHIPWTHAGFSFPNQLGGTSELIELYRALPVQIDRDYDSTRVGAVDAQERIIAEIVNLAIPEVKNA